MPKVYDDWERLVRATLRREELWQLCHEHSRTPSGGSTTSGTSPGSSSPKSLRSRVSPFNQESCQGGTRSNSEAVPSSSSARILPVNQPSRMGLNDPENCDGQKSGGESGNGLKKEKWMKKSKSRMRLDRWVWTRWLSKTF